MEKIKITGSDQIYEIRSIIPTAEHVLQIVFADTVPAAWGGDIQLYTDGDVLATTLTGWSTVYRDEGQTVYLSDDGSVYVPPADPEPVTPPEPYEPTLVELQASKKQEISAACEQAIYSGVSVTLTDGSSEHFALTEHDQLNLFGKQVQLAALQGAVEKQVVPHPHQREGDAVGALSAGGEGGDAVPAAVDHVKGKAPVPGSV